MTTRLFFSNGLPPRIVDQATRAFRQLDGTQHPLPSITTLLSDFAATHNFSDPAPIERIFSALVAANHTSDRLTGPPPPLPTNSPEVLPSRTEWLLLASRERVLAVIPDHLGIALDSLIAEFDAFGAADAQVRSQPIVDYGLGSLLAAIAGKGPDSSEFVAGNALGKLARLMVEVLLAARSSMPLLRPVLLRFVTRSVRDHLAERLDTAVAMACKPVPDKLPLFSFLGNPDVRASVVDACATWQGEVKRAVGRTNAMVAFAESMRDEIAAKLDSMRLFGFAKPPPVVEELERSIALARAALDSDPELRSAWEIQRWGDWSSVTRVGRVFPSGLCLLGLARAGSDVGLRIEEAIVKSRRIDGWRYYEDYPDIPPDTDDLGLMLRLFACLPRNTVPSEIFGASLQLLRQTLAHEDGFPVWLRHGLAEAPSSRAPLWQGPRCIAVAAQFVLGMAEAQIDGHDDLKMRAIGWICEAWEQKGEQAVFHYTLPFARLLLVKLAHAFRNAPDAFHPIRLRAIEMTLVEEIRSSSFCDGGWGSPLATACHLAVLALHSEPFQPRPGLVYLASHQGPSGLWPAESLYLCPGKDGAPAAHGDATITTGVCLDALAEVWNRLRLES